MRRRWLQSWVVGLSVLLACKGEAPAKKEPIIPTHEMSEALTRDVGVSERELAALQDSLYTLLGDSIAVEMKRAEVTWKEYRKLECGALRFAFAEGTVAPVAQLECWVELTDDRRRFLSAEYNFARPAK
jgi:uncharacterized protein YecT (DUF1311 family)